MSRRPSTLLRAPALSSLGLALACGCVHPRAFNAPHERLTENTAYTEVRRARVDVDLLAADSQKFVANVGTTVAVVRGHLSFSVNLAHGALGVGSLQSKFTVYDGRWYGLGGRVGLSYINPRTLWLLPKELRGELGSFNLVTAPLELWQSFPLTRWLGFHVALSYRAAMLWGDFDGEALLVDANFTQRAWSVEPVLDVFVARRVALRAHARLPLVSRIAEVTEAQVQLEPGLLVGVRSVEWLPRNFSQSVQLSFAAETRFGANTHVQLGVNLWAFRPLDVLAVSPSLRLYWRFH